MSNKASLLVQDLPEEIIANILSRLPVKSLLQCKSVSKPWLSLISQPYFAKLHLRQMKQDNTISFRVLSSDLLSFNPEECFDDIGDYNRQKVTVRKHRLPITIPAYSSKIVGSCDGLICITCDDEEHFAVINPTTGQFRELPKWDFSSNQHEAVFNEGFFYGFGYDNQIDDHKVVRGFVFKSLESTVSTARIEIYNLKSNSWRTIQDQHCRGYIDKESVLLNGVLHWVTRLNGRYDNQVICRFDLVKETLLDVMPLPCQFDSTLYLIVLDECLLFSVMQEEYFPIYFEAWKMMKYNVPNSWTRMSYVENGDPFDEDPNRFSPVKLLYITKSGWLWLDDDADVIVYNPKNQGKHLQIVYGVGWWFFGTAYEETLISPNIADWEK